MRALSAGGRTSPDEWGRAELAAANHIDELIDLLHQAVPLLRWRWFFAREVRHQIAAWTRLRKVLTRRAMINLGSAIEVQCHVVVRATTDVRLKPVPTRASLPDVNPFQPTVPIH